MNQKKVYYKSDFKVLLASEAGWTGLPFRLKFYTGAPTRAFWACFDGTNYENCHLHEDGRLCVAFDNHNFGFGTLRVEPTFYLNDECYRSGICDEAIPPFDVVLKDAPTEEVPEPEEYTIVLAMDGVKTLETIGTLPAFYQKGDKGEPGLTPAEHDALVQATVAANAAADRANGVIDDAEAAARLATAAAVNADNKAAAAAEAARLADAARDHVEQTEAAISAAEASRNSREAGRISNEIDRQNREAGRISNENARKSNENARVSAEAARAAAELGREERIALAVAHADTAAGNASAAAGNANTAATQAGNVNAVLDGDNLTVTDRNGQSVTRNVRGPKGDSITMFPNVTIFGQPTIQESQISGFTAQNYVQFPFMVDFAGRPWQLDCSITTGADVSQQHNVFDSAFGLAFAFSGGKFVLAMSSNGTSWNLGATSGTHSILANTTYYIRISWDGTRYVLAYSTDKETWVNDIVVTSSASLASKQIVIGKSLDNRYIFNGSINMSDAHLTISGKIVWEGMDDAGLATRMAIDLSNIDEDGKQKLNEVAMAGGVGQKLEDLSSEITDLEDRIFFNGQTIVTPTEKANLIWGGTSVQASSAGARFNGYVFELTEGVRTNTTGTLSSRYTFPSYPKVGDVGTNKKNANTEFVPTSSEKYMLVTFDGNIQPNNITFVTIREDVERNALESKVIDAQKDIKVISGVHENITIAPNSRCSYFRKVEDRNITLRVIQHGGISTSFTLFESKDGVGTGAKVLATMKPSIPTSVVVESDYPYIWIFNGDYQPNGASLTLEIYETNTIYQLTMGIRAMDGVGKKIVCLGDSITAFNDSKSKTYSDYLSDKIGCDAICGGIGGTRLVARANVTSAPANLNEAWALLDIENLAKAWCSKDWTNVDTASQMVIDSGGEGVNQSRNIANLKKTPIASANIVTIMGGTNDYAANISKEAIKTSLKAIVSTLLTANKTLEIYVISPIVRYVNASSAAQRTPDKWSDVFQNTNGDTLVDITECIREACKECHVNFINLYDTLCWNQTNFSTFFIDTDSTHPYNGFQQIAEKIAKGLSK